MTAEEKAPYEEMAKADKERHKQEMETYKSKQAETGADLDSD